MKLARRLRDATRSPRRLWWFGVRAVDLALRGELPNVLARLRPGSPDAGTYRAWLQQHPVEVADAKDVAPVPVVCFDLVDGAQRQRVMQRFAALSPPPLRLVSREADGGAAREAAETAWTLLVGADLVPDARLPARFSAALAATPRAVAAYADHDHLDAQGRRERPALKSAWDAEQAFERVSCGPVLALRPGPALDAARGAPLGEAISAAWAELAADADAAVLHVPDVLFSLPLAPVADESIHHAERGVAAARRRGANVELDAGSSPRVRFLVPQGTKLSVVVPTRDRADLVRACIDSLPARVGSHPVEIVVVDNGSTEPALRAVLEDVATRHPLAIVRRPEPFNFAALCNAGAARAGGAVLLFLNNDACFGSPDDVAELVALAARPWTGAAGPWLWYDDGRVQSAGVLVGVNRTTTSALAGCPLDDPAVVAWAQSRRRVSGVMGACLAVERRKFEAVGAFDEALAVSHNEDDLCLRLERAGFANVVTPYARVVHAEGATRGFEVSPVERTRRAAEEARFLQHWSHLMAGPDPAHHPWLSREGDPLHFAARCIDPTPRLGWRPAHG